jgi:hypothetical protein
VREIRMLRSMSGEGKRNACAVPRLSSTLLVADYDRSVFAVEGPMSDDRPWQSAAREARSRQRKVACGPTGPDRDELAAEFCREYRLAGFPPGSTVRPPP